MIIPAYDPEIQTLQLKSPECPDYNLLMILLFTRYAPDLLKIRFDKFHDPIDLENLIPHAQKINERFPRPLVTNNAKRGEYLTYNRVTCKPRKSLLRARTIHTFPAACLLLA